MTKKWALGATVHSGGVHFGVWAPFAESVSVTGDFNNWDYNATPMQKGDGGVWQVDVDIAQDGQEYQYVVHYQGKQFLRNDPRALQLTASGDKTVIVAQSFDWGSDNFTLQPHQKLLIYEMHVGTFNRPDPDVPGTFIDAIDKLDYLAQLGVTAVEVMPVNSVWEDKWWGYTPINLYAVDAAYGGRHAFLKFVKAAHDRGIGVIADVVYNHLSTDQTQNLWQFDGWNQNGKGGIYFYNDWRSQTPWGDTRLDYGRQEVRDYIADNASLLMNDCHLDGLRLDAVLAIRKAVTTEFKENGTDDIPEGWQLLQNVTKVIDEARPHTISIAEDLQGNEWITKPQKDNGAGFNAQWDVSFAACVREVMDPVADESRDMEKVKYILNGQYNNDPFQRIIFTESHDTDAAGNGHARLDEEIAPGDATNVFARKRSTLGAGLLLTAPGIPMLFQGQELMETGAFNHWKPIDWENMHRFESIVTLYRHLIKLRQNAYDNTAGLLGAHINTFIVDNGSKLVAYHRWDKGGAGDDVVVVANFSNDKRENVEITFPQPGLWRPRFNSDWKGYGADFSDVLCPDTQTKGDANKGSISIGPYSLIIFSQDRS
jgi:1,4-alpha-glucan branching enzyme